MPALYKYQRYIESGPNGVTLDFRNTQDEEATPATPLGEIDGWRYVSVPDDTALPEQPEEILWQAVTVTPELREQLKRTRPMRIAKGVVREHIEEEVGDLHDLVADCMRLCEFSLALSLRVSHEVFSGEQMSAEVRQAYAERVQTVLGAMGSGDVVLRGDLEDPDAMIMRLVERYTRISQLLANVYKPRVNDLLP